MPETTGRPSVCAVNDEPLLSSGQVAKKLGVSPRTVSHWVRQGYIRAARRTAGGMYRFRLSEVEDDLIKLRERRDG